MPMTDRETLRRYLEEALPASGYFEGRGPEGPFDRSVLEQYVHEDVVLPEARPGSPFYGPGLDGLVGHLTAISGLFQRVTVKDMVVEGEKVVARFVVNGRQTGEFMGLQGHGKEFSFEEIMIAQFRDGKVSEFWRVIDALSLVEQLGGQIGLNAH